MTIEIRTAELGIASTNTYLIGDTDTNQAILIDPVDNAPFLYNMAQEAGWKIELILATHSHFDHVLASKELQELTGAPFIIHKNAKPRLENLPEQGRRFGLGSFPEAAIPDRWLEDTREIIELAGIKLETLFTPGHAPDHIAFYLESHKILFSGDAIFEMSIGRVDLPSGDYETLMKSITEKIFPLGDDVHLLSGHGRETTIGRERRSNPFVLDYLR